MGQDKHEGVFMNSADLATTLEGLHIPVDERALKIVGVDIAPREICKMSGAPLELEDGVWRIPPQELVRIKFGVEFPLDLAESGVMPAIHWRSSNHRCGGGGLDFYALNMKSGSEPASENPLLGGELCGNYMVFNPYGIYIEPGTAMAQVSLTMPHETPEISEPLTAMQVECFKGAGRLTRLNTILPEKTVLEPIDQGWVLERDVPYLITFNGLVELSSTQVIVPSRHLSDFLRNPEIWELSGHSCLGDPGYRGRLGMLIFAHGSPESPPVTIGYGQGLGRRVARYRVIANAEQASSLPVYGETGQYQGEGWDNKKSRIEFRSWRDWPELQNVVGPESLKDLFGH